MKNLNDFESAREKIISAMQCFGPFKERRVCEELIDSEGFALRSYESHEIIYTKDKFERSVAIVVSGSAVIKKESCNNTVELKTVTVGGIFGAAALFGNCDEYTSEITAKGKETRIAFISQSAMTELFERDPGASIAYITFLSDRIRYLNGKIYCFTGADTLSKVKAYLRMNSESELSAASLARILDIGRSSLYRALALLEQEGIIEKNGKKIKVIKKEALSI